MRDDQNKSDELLDEQQLDEAIADLQEKLMPLDQEIHLPASLSGASLLALLEQEPEGEEEKPVPAVPEQKVRPFPMKKAISIAAAFAVAVGVGSVYLKMNQQKPEAAADTPETYSETNSAVLSEEGVSNASNDILYRESLSQGNPATGGIGEKDAAAAAPARDFASLRRSLGEQLVKKGAAPTKGVTLFFQEDHSGPVPALSIPGSEPLESDGQYLYAVSESSGSPEISIVDPETEAILSSIPLDEDSRTNRIYLMEDRLVWLGTSENEAPGLTPVGEVTGPMFSETEQTARQEQQVLSLRSAAVFYDISDPAHPREEGRYEQDGYYLDSRLEEDRLCLVTSKKIYGDARQDSTPMEELFPYVTANGSSRFVEPEKITGSGEDADGYAVITRMDLSEKTADAAAYLGSPEIVCIGSDVLYLADAPELSQTKLSAFRWKDALSHTVSRSLPASVTEGWQMAEQDGQLRVLATDLLRKNTGTLYLFDEELSPLGMLEELPMQYRSLAQLKDSLWLTDPDGVLTAVSLKDPGEPVRTGEIADGILAVAAREPDRILIVRSDGVTSYSVPETFPDARLGKLDHRSFSSSAIEAVLAWDPDQQLLLLYMDDNSLSIIRLCEDGTLSAEDTEEKLFFDTAVCQGQVWRFSRGELTDCLRKNDADGKKIVLF